MRIFWKQLILLLQRGYTAIGLMILQFLSLLASLERSSCLASISIVYPEPVFICLHGVHFCNCTNGVLSLCGHRDGDLVQSLHWVGVVVIWLPQPLVKHWACEKFRSVLTLNMWMSSIHSAYSCMQGHHEHNFHHVSPRNAWSSVWNVRLQNEQRFSRLACYHLGEKLAQAHLIRKSSQAYQCVNQALLGKAYELEVTLGCNLLSWYTFVQ